MDIYATCSLLPQENEQQVAAFLQNHKQFTRTGDDLRLSPAKDGTDGFFSAVLQRN